MRGGSSQFAGQRAEKEQSMSAINGDKARFHKFRKEKIARRARNRARFAEAKATTPTEQPQSKRVSQ
jgi:hypothetical protein